MKTLTSNEAEQSFNNIINIANTEPVTISSGNEKKAVIISPKRYQELTKIEDILYRKTAQLAIKEGLSSKKESEELLNSIT